MNLIKTSSSENDRLEFKVINDIDEDKEIKNKISILKKIYSTIPETVCLNRGYCCNNYKVIGIYSIEAIYIKNEIEKRFSSQKKEKIKHKIIKNILKEEEYIKIKKKSNLREIFICPFRDNDKKICVIYEFRPYVCRTYGIKGVAKSDDCINTTCKKSCKNVKLKRKIENWDCCQLENDVEKIKSLSNYYYFNNCTFTNIDNLQDFIIYLLFPQILKLKDKGERCQINIMK